MTLRPDVFAPGASPISPDGTSAGSSAATRWARALGSQTDEGLSDVQMPRRYAPQATQAAAAAARWTAYSDHSSSYGLVPSSSVGDTADGASGLRLSCVTSWPGPASHDLPVRSWPHRASASPSTTCDAEARALEPAATHARLAEAYQMRAARMLERLVSPSFVQQNPAAADVQTFLRARQKALGVCRIIAVWPRLYLGGDGFYVVPLAIDAIDAACAAAAHETQPLHDRCALALGLIDDVEAVCQEILAKCAEIQLHLLHEGGTDRLVDPAVQGCMALPTSPMFAASEAWALAAGVVGVGLGSALAPHVGLAWATLVGISTMQTSLWAQRRLLAAHSTRAARTAHLAWRTMVLEASRAQADI